MKISYAQIPQIAPYFKMLVSAPNLAFLPRRRLMILNELLEKETEFLKEEMKRLAETYCVRDEKGEFIFLEDGSQKIKEDMLTECQEKLNEIYSTEIELEFQPFKLKEDYFADLKCNEETVKLIVENFIEK